MALAIIAEFTYYDVALLGPEHTPQHADKPIAPSAFRGASLT